MYSKQDLFAGTDPEIFSRGGPSLTYNCGSAQIWKITNFFISSNIGDIKLCKFQGRVRTPPLDPRMIWSLNKWKHSLMGWAIVLLKMPPSEKKSTTDQKLDFIRWYHTYSLQVSIGKKQGKVNLICFFYVVSWIILKWQLTKFQY